MRLARAVAVAVAFFGLMSWGRPAFSATFVYSLDQSLGVHQLNRGNVNVDYPVDLGRQFSRIDSVTLHIAGYMNPAPGTTARVSQMIHAYANDSTLTDLRGVGLGTQEMGAGSFDWSYTIIDQTPSFTEFRQYLCLNHVKGLLIMPGDYTDPRGTVTMTASTMTIVGTPVPEPASVISLLCGVGLLAGRTSRRRPRAL